MKPLSPSAKRKRCFVAETRTFTCDGCGAVKKESNHWWKLAVESEVLLLARWDETGWLNREDTPVAHVCGRACALKKVEEFMSHES